MKTSSPLSRTIGSSLRLRTKILLAPGVGVVLFLIFLAFTLGVSTGNTRRLDTIRDVAFPTLTIANTNISLIEKITENLNSGVATGEKDTIEAADAISAKVRKNLTDFAALDADQKAAAEAALKQFDAYYAQARELSLGLITKQLDMAQAGPKMSEMGNQLSELNKQLAALRDGAQQRFVETVDASVQSSHLMLSVGGIGFLAILGASVFAWVMSASIARSVNSVLKSMRDFANGQGDLTRRIDPESNDEIGELVLRFNEFVSRLHTDIGSLVTSVHALESTVDTLGSAVSEAESHANEGHAVMTSVTNGVSEIRQGIDQVAHSAGQASSAAAEADEAAKGGYRNIRTTIDIISELAKSVQSAFVELGQLRNDAAQIDTVVNAIKGIADQTNLLALNAAIEAARAGESGRGFAVVADEVRKLSVQTQDATIEVATIVGQLEKTMASLSTFIESSQAHAITGVEQIRNSGKALEEITDKVSTIRSMNNEIAQTSDQQKRGAQTIAQSIDVLDTVSSSTLSHSNELADASQQIRGLASQLKGITAQFKI